MLFFLFISPLPISILLFIVFGAEKGKIEALTYAKLCKYVFGYGLLVAMVCLIGILIWTGVTGGSQGPLSFIFFGPASFSIGEVFGYILLVKRYTQKGSDKKQ